MRKILLIFLMLIILPCFANAGKLLVAKAHVSSFTITEMKDLRDKLVNFSRNHPQPANRFSALINVSTDTAESGIAYSSTKTDIKTNSESREALIQVDAGVLTEDYFQQLINAGKIEIITVYGYTRKGYIRDDRFKKMQWAYREFRDKYYRYEVEVSTP